MNIYTQEHLDLLIAVAKAETKLTVYNQLAQSWNAEFEDFMESKIEKAEQRLEEAQEKLDTYEKSNKRNKI